MTTALVRPVPAHGSRLTVRTVGTVGKGLTAQQLADTARRVADTYPELLTPAEFDPTPLPSNDEPVASQHRVGRSTRWRLPVVLGRPIAVVAHTTAALVALPGRAVKLVTSAEQTLTAMHATVVRTNALLDRVEGVVQDAHRAVEQAGALTARAAPLLESYSEPLHRLAPMVRRLAETTQSDEVDALVTLLDRLPQLADATAHVVIPLLGDLKQLGPEMNQLLDSVSRLSHMASRLPRVFRRPDRLVASSAPG